MTGQKTRLDALRTSVGRLRGIVEPLADDAIVESAYPTEWTIAQVMSHLGSGAVILQRGLEDQLAGSTTPDDFAPGVWDEWNARTPRAQVDDGLAADRAFLAALDAVSAEQREAFSFAMGPLSVDFDGFVGLRLNEHAFHTWDIEVTLDAAATIPTMIAERVVDNLGLITRFTAKPSDGPATIDIRTTAPQRHFTLELTADGAVLAPAAGDTSAADLELPAEALARLVYGRLDPAHAPAFVGSLALVERLRAAFPGP